MAVTADLFTVAAVEPAALAAALAAAAGVSPADVDVADADGDQESRTWDAPVLCSYTLLPSGGLGLVLDVYVVADEDPSGAALTEAELARRLAAASGTTVFYPAEWFPPSAYWAVTADGLVTRALLVAPDDECGPFTVDAVGAPVADLPAAVVRDDLP
ncbi:hypothetical protein AB0M39_10330 [Streptomyces sp. NPDC051907]|uniref:hypothetical protein n=1 Tax=Streptomyces sp. NPDC051907 TaxID=3155284 RepID=UPI00343AFAB3